MSSLPNKRNLFGKLMGAHAILIAVIFLTLVVASSYLLEYYFHRAKQREVIANADKIVLQFESVAQGGLPVGALTETLRTFSEFTGMDAWMVDAQENVLVTSTSLDSGVPWILSDLAELREGKTVVRREKMETSPRPVLVVALPIHEGDDYLGSVFVQAPLIGVNTTIRGVQRLLLIAGLISITLAIIVSYVISRRIASPLARFTKAVGKMTQGDFDIRVDGEGPDEVVRLGEAFNHLGRELRATVDRLEQESLRVATVLASMSDGVIVVNQEGYVELLNDSAYPLLSGGGDALGRPYRDALASEKVATLFQESLQGRRNVESEVHIGTRDFTVKISPVAGERVPVWGAVGVFRDTSEQRAFERMRRDFVANVSHELRTPLTSIRGFLEAVLDGVAQSPEEAQEYLRIAMGETERMRRLALSLLDLSGIEQGRLHLERRPVHIHRVVMTVLDKLTTQINAKKLKVHLDIEESLPTVFADSDKLEQVILNLIDNAVQFSQEGHELWVKAHLRGENARMASHVKISVTDSGPGLTPEQQKQVWDRFYRADKSRQSSTGGAGLGLAIVKELVEAHDGEVGIKSGESGGSTFYFRIPLYTPKD